VTGEPKGYRNNNPWNIRVNPNFSWVGQVGADADGFVIFDSAENGMRAAHKLLRNYQRLHNIRTVAGIINRASPPSENNTDAYILAVSHRTGYATNVTLDLENNAVRAKLLHAIFIHENGYPKFAEGEIFNAGALV